MKLYLVQHGDALSKDIDPDRALSPKGHDDMARMAAFLKDKVVPEKVLHSSKTRARQSAEILANILAPKLSPQAIDGINPNDPVEPIAQEIIQSSENLLLVGHLPFISRLAAFLATSSEKSITDFQPGSMLCLASENNEGWQVEWMVRPELLQGTNK